MIPKEWRFQIKRFVDTLDGDALPFGHIVYSAREELLLHVEDGERFVRLCLAAVFEAGGFPHKLSFKVNCGNETWCFVKCFDFGNEPPEIIDEVIADWKANGGESFYQNIYPFSYPFFVRPDDEHCGQRKNALGLNRDTIPKEWHPYIYLYGDYLNSDDLPFGNILSAARDELHLNVEDSERFIRLCLAAVFQSGGFPFAIERKVEQGKHLMRFVKNFSYGKEPEEIIDTLIADWKAKDESFYDRDYPYYDPWFSRPGGKWREESNPPC